MHQQLHCIFRFPDTLYLVALAASLSRWGVWMGPLGLAKLTSADPWSSVRLGISGDINAHSGTQSYKSLFWQILLPELGPQGHTRFSQHPFLPSFLIFLKNSACGTTENYIKFHVYQKATTLSKYLVCPQVLFQKRPSSAKCIVLFLLMRDNAN